MILVMFKHCLSKNDISMKSLLLVYLNQECVKSIHYTTLSISRTKINRFEGQNMGCIPPPISKHGGIYHPHPPPVIYALGPKPGSLRYCTVKLHPFGYAASEFNSLFSIT